MQIAFVIFITTVICFALAAESNHNVELNTAKDSPWTGEIEAVATATAAAAAVAPHHQEHVVKV